MLALDLGDDTADDAGEPWARSQVGSQFSKWLYSGAATH